MYQRKVDSCWKSTLANYVMTLLRNKATGFTPSMRLSQPAAGAFSCLAVDSSPHIVQPPLLAPQSILVQLTLVQLAVIPPHRLRRVAASAPAPLLTPPTNAVNLIDCTHSCYRVSPRIVFSGCTYQAMFRPSVEGCDDFRAAASLQPCCAKIMGKQSFLRTMLTPCCC
jgi:hypothetical protein